MLSYLIDAEDFVENRLRVDINYFECTNDFIKSLLSGWSDAEINSAQQKLEDRGLISILKVGVGKGCLQHKFIKLNVDKIIELRNVKDVPIDDSEIVKIKKSSTT